MAYFSAYFDESFQEGSPVLAVSGYYASDVKWEWLARRWDEIVEREKVTAFHWSHLETFNGEFSRDKGWDEARRLSVQKELIPLIRMTIDCGICVAINVPEYEQYLLEKGRGGYETAYTYAVRMAVHLAAMEAQRLGFKERVAYLIERSTKKHKAELERAFRHVFADEEWAERLRLGSLTTDANRIDNVPLQPADVIAYETWKDAHNVLVENRKRPRRRSLLSLINARHLYGYVDGASLRRMEDEREYEVRYLHPDDY